MRHFSLWHIALLALMAAGLMILPTFEPILWPLAWVALVPIWFALTNISVKRAFLLGWWMEAFATWIGFYWLVGTMVNFGHISVPFSLVLFAIIGLGNGIRLGLYTWWLRWLAVHSGPTCYRLLMPPCTFVMLDYLYPRVFPWALGITQWGATPLTQIADVTGVHGITFLLVTFSVTVTALIPHPNAPAPAARWRMSLACLVLIGATLGYGFRRMPQVHAAIQAADPLRVAIVQPNVGFDEKGDRAKRDAQFIRQINLSRVTLTDRPDLIIWPETMYPYAVPSAEQSLVLPRLQDAPDTHWLIGALVYNQQGNQFQRFNAALLVDSETRIIDRYAKQRLLAFGERIPMEDYFPFLRNISRTIGNLTPGEGGVVTLPNDTRIGPLICYEDILPDLGRQAVQQGAAFLINLTNNAWFGPTYAPYQHRQLAAFRAIENRVYLVRATNTGLTSVIDPLGREHATLPTDQPGTRVHAIHPLRMPTIYTRYGDGFAQLCSAIALLLPLWYWRSSRGQRP
ncbi:apolipoprotein N-acyltransferase [Candidatus Entotheonella palauensis]|nr:apolipoprotein N-acyltransferase [Candidatus Entotheonella palauensis]